MVLPPWKVPEAGNECNWIHHINTAHKKFIFILTYFKHVWTLILLSHQQQIIIYDYAKVVKHKLSNLIIKLLENNKQNVNQIKWNFTKLLLTKINSTFDSGPWFLETIKRLIHTEPIDSNKNESTKLRTVNTMLQMNQVLVTKC